MTDPRLERLGRTRALEGWIEGQLPVTLMGCWWVGLYFLFSRPGASRGFSSLELSVLLGAGVALSAWTLSRLMHLFGVRRPLYFLVAGLAIAATSVLLLDHTTMKHFRSSCVELQHGAIVEPLTFQRATELRRPVCVVGRSPDSAYLGGTLLRAPWGGSSDLGWPVLLVLALSSMTGALAFRDRRVRRSRLARDMIESFGMASAAGVQSVQGKKTDGAAIVACSNATMWGELCGQLYWDGAITAEDPCVRCGFNFHPGDTVTLKVVGMSQDRVDKLNILERGYSPTEPWGQGTVGPSEGTIRMSARGPARWSEIGEFTLPRTLTVAQVLAIIGDQLGGGIAGRMSRVAAWMWFLPGDGQLLPNLAVQPGARYSLVAATERLSDVLERHSGRPMLQIDIGLIPVQFRFGNRRLRSHNLNQNLVLWLPVRSPHDKGEAATSWVPRIESAALRTWLGVVRRSGEDERVRDLDVMSYVWPPGHDAGRWRDGAGRPMELLSPKQDGPVRRLTMVRMVWGEAGEPRVDPQFGLLGARLDEWEWLDREQIEQLREGVVVAMPDDFEQRLVQRVESIPDPGGAASPLDPGGAA